MKNEHVVKPAAKLGFLSGGGLLGALIANFDWSDTALGPIEQWTPWLKSSVSLMLRSQVPMVILWGEDGYMIYNDAYAVFAGARHPRLLGAKVLEGWPEVSDFNQHVLNVVLAGGTLSFEDQELVLNRGARPTAAWMNLDYSPILDDFGTPVGVIAIVVETTGKVIAERWRTSERDRQARMFEQAPGFMAMMNGPTHIFEMANAGYRQLVGNRPLIGRTVEDAFPDIAGQGFLELLDQVYRTGEPFVGMGIKAELQRNADGPKEDRFIDLIYQPIRNPEQEVIGILCQGIDVTQRLDAEKALRNSEARFRVLAEAMPNHVWTANADGQLDWFNPRVYEFAGAAEGALDGENWTSLVHPEDLPKTAENWQVANASGTVYENQFRLRRRDGAYRWYIARAIPMRDATGEITQWVGTNTDIHEQKRAVEALTESERRLQVSQKAAGIGSLEVDIPAGIVKGTPQLWDIWGVGQRDSMTVKDMEDIVVSEDASLRSSSETRAQGTTPQHVEYRIRRPDTGEVRWVSRSLEFVNDKDGKPSKIYGVMQDITERKDAEMRQITLAHELEHRIKNILAMVGAIASQTLRNTDIATARATLSARLEALAGAHDILNHTRWSDVSILEVVRSAIAAFERERFDISGPALAITPKQAISLALAVNELATNAVKYGALSTTNGKVEIKWDVAPGADGKNQLTWTWAELDGPSVQPPTRKGFGSVLVSRVLGADFGGTMSIAYEPSGVSCVLIAPWSSGEAPAPRSPKR